MVAFHVIKYLQSKGHDVRVILHQAGMYKIRVPYSYDGIDVMGPTSNMDQYRWADLMITHLDYSQFTIAIGEMLKIPVLNMIHNDIPYSSVINARHSNYVVYNSDWIRKKLNYKWPSMVLYPPCDVGFYNVCEKPINNECITLISLNENKGGNVFYEVARRMPDRKFLGVRGSYDHQIIKDLPNVEIIPNTPDILQVYKRTRILLMPSRYESWGRTATEAMASGIPVICAPTPGLSENCADAGLYCEKRAPLKPNNDPNDIEDDEPAVLSIIRQIKKLDKPNFYAAVSQRCLERAAELNPEKQLNELNEFIKTIGRDHQPVGIRKQSFRTANA